MPDQQDHRTRESAELAFDEFLGKPGHDKPSDRGRVHPNDPVTKAHVDADGIEPDWHKHGRTTPPGWVASGDTFVEAEP